MPALTRLSAYTYGKVKGMVDFFMYNLYMYILSGMSFAGKSVLARGISEAKQIEIVDPDAIAHARGLV